MSIFPRLGMIELLLLATGIFTIITVFVIILIFFVGKNKKDDDSLKR